MTEPGPAANMCSESVRSDIWNNRPCGRPVRFVIRIDSNNSVAPRFACGVHVRWYRNNGWDVEPIEVTR